MVELSGFILEHENDDPASLVLQRDRWPGIDVALAAECIASRRKLRYKVPEWYADPRIICPVSLSAEQCSSTATAAYKASVAKSVLPEGGRIADLTGGLGVDCAHFCGVAGEVLYNECNPLLLEAAKRNLPLLGCRNARFSGISIDADTLPALLDSFRPDLIFADPARRGDSGRKLFLPEDCSPDVLALQDIILDRGCGFLLKLSPMADISLMLKKFHNVKQVHVVEWERECKELLLLMEPGFTGDPVIRIAVLTESAARTCEFNCSEVTGARPLFMEGAPRKGQVLFEPGAALSKSGALGALSSLYMLPKLGPSAHILCFGEEGKVDGKVFSALEGLGKWFLITEVAEFGKKALRDFAGRWPDAEASSRALPVSSEELRSRMRLHGGGSTHIFAVGSSAGRLLIAASRETPALR